MAKKFPLRPAHPERLCWGCDRYCPADDLACGNGSDRTQHPLELLGEDWADWRPLDGPGDTGAADSGQGPQASESGQPPTAK